MDTVVSASGTVLLVARSSNTAVERADFALQVATSGDDSLRPHLYEVGTEHVVLLGSRGLELPTRVHADGRRRIDPANQHRTSVVRATPQAIPFLIEISAPIDRVGFVDPIAASVVGIGGEPDRRAVFARAMARAAVAAAVDVIVLGVGDASIDLTPVAAITCTTVAEVLAYLQPRPPSGRAAIVFVDPLFTAGHLGELADSARRSPRLGIVLLEPGASADLFLALPEPPRAYFGALGPTTANAPARTAVQRPVGQVEIAILGPTEIHGAEGSLVGRPRLTELVVYLAMHPEGAGTRTWSAALWPDRRVPPQTVANRLSEARGLLGFAKDGRPRLRKSGDRHLITEVVTDWSRFCAMSTPDAGPSGWRAALGLVRGRPFDDLAQGSWTMLEGFAGEIEQGIVECALRLGDYCLDVDDPEGAVVAAQLATRASPWDERLCRLLMRAADAAGNRQGVEAAFRQLALLLEVDGDPMVGVHPETAALYAQLSGAVTTRAVN